MITSIGKVVALSKCVRVEIGWRQKSPTAVTASLETRPTMDGEPERQGARARRLGPRARKRKDEP
ncbi:hypothetical protein PMX66_04680, partial [Collinsella aerofaciens]|uniref:hypothetical protein n=1 Tax=Collinsella aerofaciens TaxID=74426 RepID=UPI00232F1F86